MPPTSEDFREQINLASAGTGPVQGRVTEAARDFAKKEEKFFAKSFVKVFVKSRVRGFVGRFVDFLVDFLVGGAAPASRAKKSHFFD